LGIYAIDPDEGEILYAVAYSDPPDYLPSAGTTVVEYMIDLTIVVGNAENDTAVIDPKYIPFLEVTLDATTTLAERIQILRKEVEDLQLAKERLFANDRETFKDIESLNQIVKEIATKLETLNENLLALTASFYNLAYYVLRNTYEIKKLKEVREDEFQLSRAATKS